MSILFSKGKELAQPVSSDTYAHLALDEIIDMIAIKDNDKKLIRDVFMLYPNDYDTVLLRQEILKDFMVDKGFCVELEGILEKLGVLKEYSAHNHFIGNKKSSVYDLLDYIEEMDVYIQVIEELNKFFDTFEVKSKGLNEIKELVRGVIAADKIPELKEIVGAMKSDIATLKSMTIGINLTPDLEPEEVIFLNFNKFPFKSRLEFTDWAASMSAQKKIVYKERSRLMGTLCAETEKELAKSVRRVKHSLKNYVDFKGYSILDICNDLKFFLLMAKFATKLDENNYTYCFPVINKESSDIEIKGLYNIRLLEKEVKNIVKNDLTFSDEKVFILTGPNRGGKTMLTQGVGIISFFAAQGLYVPADRYEGRLFDNILTHFPADENQTLNLGRLGEEAVRIKEIAKEATSNTLVLFNETYSSTSAYDGLYLAKDLVHILKHKGISAIFNTHIHELARSVEEMNTWDGDTKVVSLTMEIENNVNTFRVLRKEPDHSSFAKNIAMKYGVTYEQMLQENN